jgi:bacillolysin
LLNNWLMIFLVVITGLIMTIYGCKNNDPVEEVTGKDTIKVTVDDTIKEEPVYPLETGTIVVRGENGTIQSVTFSESDTSYTIPNSSTDFFENWLNVSTNDQFRETLHVSKRKGYVHEHFDQYYNGVKVDGAGYNFHYKDGKMYYANGYYVPIGKLNVIPSLSPKEAKNSFAGYKNIPIELVTDFISELLIKEVADETGKEKSVTPRLVYKIYLFANHDNNNEVGYVDAQTGKVLLTEPSWVDYSATGTFVTRYNGSRQV